MKTKIIILLCFICALFYGTDYSATAEAAAKNSSYKFLSIRETPVKTGKYYLKCSIENGTENIYISRKKNQNYKKTPLTSQLCCNGKQAYYTENAEKEAYLYKYNLSSGKKTKVKKMENGEELWTTWNVSAVYKSNIYITRRDENYGFREDTYMYNMKKKSFSEIKKNCAIVDSHGKYALSMDACRSDITPYPVSLWKFTASGMKKIKRLVKWGNIPSGGTAFKNKIYYVSCPSASYKKSVLYQCDLKGSNKKKIATIETSDVNGVFIHEVTEKSCVVYMGGEKYRYIYKSGEMKKI